MKDIKIWTNNQTTFKIKKKSMQILYMRSQLYTL